MSDEIEESEVVPTAMVLASESEGIVSLEELGFITPIATPTRLRQAFADKQRVYAAILDESDYIYTVAFQENGRTKQNIYSRRQDAQKAADAYKVEIRASPKKSGIVKLASALGIESRRKLTRGLPDDPAAAYSYVVYEAMHKRTGRSEEGIGWCDKTERGGRISQHDVIATADTRAYNRAVLRLAGFGDVSADEIVAGGSSEEGPPEVITLREPAPRPPVSSDDVIAAQRCWADESSKREAGFLPDAQQTSKVAREMRAKARRGNETVARQMGAVGYAWQGIAQDTHVHDTFEVEAPQITPGAIELVRTAALGSGKETGPGWNLSGTGSEIEENRGLNEQPVSRAQAAAQVRAPGMTTQSNARQGDIETITNAQAKALSEKLLAKFGTKDAAQAWLRKHADVERSSLVRQSQYDNLDKLLAKEN